MENDFKLGINYLYGEAAWLLTIARPTAEGLAVKRHALSANAPFASFACLRRRARGGLFCLSTPAWAGCWSSATTS
jgi:hypothetical protein